MTKREEAKLQKLSKLIFTKPESKTGKPTKSIYDLVDKEVKDRKVRKYYNGIIEIAGHIGIIYVAVDEAHIRGEYIYPTANKYYKQLNEFLQLSLKEECDRYTKPNYTVFIYRDEEGSNLFATRKFNCYSEAVKYADKYVNKYARVEIIDIDSGEKCY